MTEVIKMIPAAEIKVNIDEKAVRDFIENELKKQIHQNVLLVDLPKMAEITNMSPRHLEDSILRDSRIKQFERRKQRKRWWIWDNDGVGAKGAIIEILNDW